MMTSVSCMECPSSTFAKHQFILYESLAAGMVERSGEEEGKTKSLEKLRERG